jgi:hypothetical protein
LGESALEQKDVISIVFHLEDAGFTHDLTLGEGVLIVQLRYSGSLSPF